MEQDREHQEIRVKACKLLCGERNHVDDILRFIQAKFRGGHGLGAIAGLLELSYTELYDVLIETRLRIRDLSKEKKRITETVP